MCGDEPTSGRRAVPDGSATVCQERPRPKGTPIRLWTSTPAARALGISPALTNFSGLTFISPMTEVASSPAGALRSSPGLNGAHGVDQGVRQADGARFPEAKRCEHPTWGLIPNIHSESHEDQSFFRVG